MKQVYISTMEKDTRDLEWNKIFKKIIITKNKQNENNKKFKRKMH